MNKIECFKNYEKFMNSEECIKCRIRAKCLFNIKKDLHERNVYLRNQNRIYRKKLIQLKYSKIKVTD